MKPLFDWDGRGRRYVAIYFPLGCEKVDRWLG